MTYLTIDQPQVLWQQIGLITCSSSGPNSLVLQANQTAKFPSPEYLYSLNFNNTTFWFRFNSVSFDGTVTTFSQVQWLNNVHPGITSYTNASFSSWVNERKALYGRKLCTIGDSITWLGFGSYLRNLLRDGGLQYDFIGSYIDTFGWRHNGHGGDTTVDKLNTINLIPTCDSYQILIGTNDYAIGLTAQQTVTNILSIISKLQDRNEDAKFNVISLLSRIDIPQHSIDVNNLLQAQLPSMSTIKYIDLWSQLPQLGGNPNWASYLVDGIHPNLAGYQLMAPLLVNQII